MVENEANGTIIKIPIKNKKEKKIDYVIMNNNNKAVYNIIK